jgi:hypothetical protein
LNASEVDNLVNRVWFTRQILRRVLHMSHCNNCNNCQPGLFPMSSICEAKLPYKAICIYQWGVLLGTQASLSAGIYASHIGGAQESTSSVIHTRGSRPRLFYSKLHLCTTEQRGTVEEAYQLCRCCAHRKPQRTARHGRDWQYRAAANYSKKLESFGGPHIEQILNCSILFSGIT